MQPWSNYLTENNTPATRQSTEESIGFVHFRPTTVKRELRRLNSSKATGPDNIPARVLKECADALCKPLSRLFSPWYAKRRQPALWKTARMAPIHKKKSKAQPSNSYYRPISLLIIIPKVMEAIIIRTIVNFLEKDRGPAVSSPIWLPPQVEHIRPGDTAPPRVVQCYCQP